MVNAIVVNAGSPCFSRAVFCVFFLVSGRFLRFKNPVKYNSNSRINLETVHFPRGRAVARLLITQRFQWLMGRLKVF